MNALWSTAARVVTLVVSLICGVLSARLVITEAGVEHYAFLSLLVAIPGLITFSDLGTGAAIVNALAESDDPRSDELLRRKTRSVMRIMAGTAGVLATLNLVLLLTDGWSVLLGGGAEGIENASLAAFCCTAVLCLTICLGIWQRVLLGLGRNPIIILLQGLISPVSLLIVWLLLGTGLDGVRPFLAIGSFAATLLVAALGFLVAVRLTGPLLPESLRALPFPRRHPGARVMDVGWPMLAQMLTGPLAMTAPRYILAFSASSLAIAQYGVAGQVFFALQSLVSATGVALWPRFAAQRRAGRIRGGPFLFGAVFGALLAIATLMILLVGPWLFGLIADDHVPITAGIILSFGTMVTLQAVLYPLGMFMMDAPGLRFQVLPSLLMAVSTVGLTFALVPLLGVCAPPLANAASVLLFQIVPYGVYIRRHRARLYGAPAA